MPGAYHKGYPSCGRPRRILGRDQQVGYGRPGGAIRKANALDDAAMLIGSTRDAEAGVHHGMPDPPKVPTYPLRDDRLNGSLQDDCDAGTSTGANDYGQRVATM